MAADGSPVVVGDISGDTTPGAYRSEAGGVFVAKLGPAGDIVFAASWSDWREVSVVVQLVEGTHRIRLTATGQSGPNLDSMTVLI